MARTVMIADDSPTVQKKASGVLTGEGIDVVTVSNGVAAIKKLPAARPLVVLADVSMPGKDGYEVCEFIKSSPDFVQVPVVLVFSDDDVYDEQRGVRVGADGRIRKPFDHDELIAVVGKFIAASESAMSKPRMADTLTSVESSKPAVVTEPVDEEPTIAPRQAMPDFGALSGEFGIGGLMPEEPSALAIENQEHAALADISSAATAATLEEPAPVAVQPPTSETEPAPKAEAAAAEETAPPQVAEHAADQLAPTIEPAGQKEETAGESPWMVSIPKVSASLADQPSALESAEPAPPVSEESPSASEPAAALAEPALIEEETVAPPPAAHPPKVEGTMVFRVPAEIAEPVLKDELSPQPPEVEQAPPEPEPVPESASNLESFSLDEAATGHVRLSGSEERITEVPSPEPAPMATPSELAAPAPAFNYDQVYEIVCKVVARMSPNALPLPVIEEMSKTIADEIIEELNSPPAPNP